LGFGIWNLFVIWILTFGFWSMGLPRPDEIGAATKIWGRNRDTDFDFNLLRSLQ
jgi:hypothetical protein